MTQDPTEAQNLKAQYEAKVAADLHANTEEQSRIAEEIDALRERLDVLAREQGMLTGVRQALGGGAPVATTADPAPAPAAESAKVPRARAGTPAQANASAAATPEAAPSPVPAPAAGSAPAARAAQKAPARTTSKPAARTKPAGKASAKSASKDASKSAAKNAPKTQAKSPATTKAPAKAPAEAEAKPATSSVTAPATSADTTPAPTGRVTLRELIARQLAAHGEPRSAAEVGATLREEHPDRELKGNVVRTTLEALVAKGVVRRSRQQKSVYYTHTTAAGTTARD
ncbi:BlaI/MecI/CopY family transcriptional regulator [Streptomyces sp. NPDC088923]|uniref:BlaI/MecI/CopY family transcriptional regulator n=1 Tax=Streptomyces sp. NPDC088923 TaxID=3365913 RepID=UPI0038131A59